jgi:hypothetical protein
MDDERVTNSKSGLNNSVTYLAVSLLFIAFGIFFVLFTAPSLYLILEFQDFPSASSFLRENQKWIESLWVYQKDTQTLFSNVLLVVCVSFILGIMTQQLSGTLASVVAFAWNRLPLLSRRKLFSFASFLEEDLGRFKIFLLKNKPCKSEWEWELIHFYCYWFIFLNWTIFIAALMICCFKVLNTWALVFSLGSWLFFFAHAIGRSRTMYLVNKACLEFSNAGRRGH